MSQDTFLKDNVGKVVNVFTVDSYHHWGILKSFDSWTLLLENPNRSWQTRLIYKSAVVSIEGDFY